MKVHASVWRLQRLALGYITVNHDTTKLNTLLAPLSPYKPICIYIYIYVCICVCVRVYIYIYTYVYIYAYDMIHKHIHKCP